MNKKVIVSLLLIIIGVTISAIVIMKIITLFNKVELPNVVGLTKENAQQLVEQAGLRYFIEGEEYSNEIEKDHIISQESTDTKKHNNKVEKGSGVKVKVSLGTEN